MKRLYLMVVVFLLLIVAPLLLWQFQKKQPVSVAIIDKTVTDTTYREHLGLTWLMNYGKFADSQPSDNYVGTQPTTEKEQIRSTLPTNYDAYDMIYIADTYGVYEDDFSDRKHKGRRSEKILGGMEDEEWKAIVERLRQPKKSTLVAEYNSFASPTTQQVSDEMTAYLGVKWTGWIGRYFTELDYKKNADIPQWVIDQYGDEWPYEGAGFILVHDKNEQLIVLEQGKEVKGEGIKVHMTKEGEKQFGFTKKADYHYWFDIVTANYGTDTLAKYDWQLTKAGEQRLKDNKIPLEFAAITKRQRDYNTSYYFAGDYNDVSKVPSFYKMKGLAKLYEVGTLFAEDSFYWRMYVPVMQSILSSHVSYEPKPLTPKEKQQTYASAEGPYNARIHDNTFEVWRNNKWESLTIKGVNIGMGKPGYFPGEAAITEEEYYRWFKHIKEMNSNTIRVYTLQPPGFYRALKHFNEGKKEPLYVMHGVWIEEAALADSLDAYGEPTLSQFKAEMERLVDVVHGNRYVPFVAGHAHGMYDTDVSEYISAWIIGIEWYQHMVVNTNQKYATIGQYQGEFFETKDAAPFEHWLAEQMDTLTKYQYEKYQWLTPMSFTNWVTTDILKHEDEPDEDEDIVGVNPNVIYTKGAMKGPGQFASYHVYPYYPDFFNYDEHYLNFIDHRGEKNSYAGYLRDLHEAHRMPILIAEFGVPASRGKTHDNVYGFSQGFNSEKEQGEIIRHLFEDIMAEDLLGGLVFTWQDEWFKRTWNTVDYDDPDRRPYWSNVQTNEQRFGLMAFDKHAVEVDGQYDDWKDVEPLIKTKDATLHVQSDESFLYMKIKSKSKNPRIILDTVPNQGNTKENDTGDIFPSAVEYIIKLNQQGESRIVQDLYYDYFNFLYAKQLKLMPDRMSNVKKDTGDFSTIDYVLNKAYILPKSKRELPFTWYETGKLREGNSNPTNKDFDSLADYHQQGDTIELRIPWLLIGATDPSRKMFLGDFITAGEKVDVAITSIDIGLYFEGQETPSTLTSYTWNNWDLPQSKERLKASYPIVKKLFGEY